MGILQVRYRKSLQNRIFFSDVFHFLLFLQSHKNKPENILKNI